MNSNNSINNSNNPLYIDWEDSAGLLSHSLSGDSNLTAATTTTAAGTSSSAVAASKSNPTSSTDSKSETDKLDDTIHDVLSGYGLFKLEEKKKQLLLFSQ